MTVSEGLKLALLCIDKYRTWPSIRMTDAI